MEVAPVGAAAGGRRLLESTSEPIEKISQSCGFPTAASFRLHFRRETGMTPASYRREAHQR
jgi:AraC family transcriptional regulator, transcriptional activator FtrA